jgi:hypothetical protein
MVRVVDTPLLVRITHHAMKNVIPRERNQTILAMVERLDEMMSTSGFAAFTAPLIGLPVSHVWRGHGSALFLEFGQLRPSTAERRDGSQGNPEGEMTLMIEWSWRIEGRRSILCGSWSEERKWARAFALLRNAAVTNVALFGRLPEIELCLSNDARVLSFMTSEGDPQWALFDRRENPDRWLSVHHRVLQPDS